MKCTPLCCVINTHVNISKKEEKYVGRSRIQIIQGNAISGEHSALYLQEYFIYYLKSDLNRYFGLVEYDQQKQLIMFQSLMSITTKFQWRSRYC